MKTCPTEPALFVKFYPNGSDFLLVSTSTDDFLCAFTKEYVFADFKNFIDSLVPITVQTGTVLKYLNVRIIQIDYGVSIDQTQHIKTKIVDKYFPLDKTECLKSADTLYRTDSKYEKALAEALSAQGKELADLEQKYGGTYHSLVGEFLHIE